MKKYLILATTVALLLPISAPVSLAADYLGKVSESVVRLDSPRGPFCSGFVIKGQRPATILTALHCIEAGDTYHFDIKIDGNPIRVLQINVAQDLAVIETDIKRPALKPRKEPITAGMLVTGIGHGNGLLRPVFTQSVVINTVYNPLNQQYLLLSKWAFSEGMSGGPVVDTSGKVIGIIQWEFLLTDGTAVDAGTPIDTILEITKDYWETK